MYADGVLSVWFAPCPQEGITPSSIHVTIEPDDNSHDPTGNSSDVMLTTPTSGGTQEEEDSLEAYDSVSASVWPTGTCILNVLL